jgi:hypothetical protein
MTVRIEKEGSVWTVIHDRPEARNAMDPESADALTAAFLEFDANNDASVAVLYGSVRSTLSIRLASSIFRPHGHRAMVAKFRVDRWGPLGLSWISQSSRQSRALQSLAVWNWGYGVISA